MISMETAVPDPSPSASSSSSSAAGPADWEVAHREVVRLSSTKASLEHALGRALLQALRAECWQALGFASFNEYAGMFVGLTPRQTEERLRVAFALEQLPKLDAALESGKLHFTGVRELTRVVVPDTEDAWIAAAQGKSVSEIAEMVSGHRPGDNPGDPKDETAKQHTIVLHVSAETYATYREAIAHLRRQTDAHMTDEDGLLLMARRALGGGVDEGRSSYQIHMTMCTTCRRTTIDGRGKVFAVDATAAEVADCDAQRMDDTGKAQQDISPTVRRLVLRRQHGKCAVPSCHHAIFNDVHHLKLRSESGTHDEENLICLCVAHHHAVHRGALIVEGSFTAGLKFRHADGSAYGVPANPKAIEILKNVHTALTGLGFKEREARAAVDGLRPHVGAENLPIEEWLRRALQHVMEVRRPWTADTSA